MEEQLKNQLSKKNWELYQNFLNSGDSDGNRSRNYLYDIIKTDKHSYIYYVLAFHYYSNYKLKYAIKYFMKSLESKPEFDDYDITYTNIIIRRLKNKQCGIHTIFNI